MADEQQSRPPAADRPDGRDQIMHARAIDRAAVDVRIAGEIVGDARLQPDAAQLGDQPAAHRVAIGGCRRDAAARRRGSGRAGPRRGWRRTRPPAAARAGRGGRAAIPSAPARRAAAGTGPAAPPRVSCRPSLVPASRKPYRFRGDLAIGRPRTKRRQSNGLSGGRGRRDRQCRAGDAEHPRRAPIPDRRARRGGEPALDRHDDRFRRQRHRAQGPQHRAFRFRGLGHRALLRRLGRVEAIWPDRRRRRLHGDRQQLPFPDGPGRAADRAGGEPAGDRSATAGATSSPTRTARPRRWWSR